MTESWNTNDCGRFVVNGGGGKEHKAITTSLKAYWPGEENVPQGPRPGLQAGQWKACSAVGRLKAAYHPPQAALDGYEQLVMQLHDSLAGLLETQQEKLEDYLEDWGRRQSHALSNSGGNIVVKRQRGGSGDDGGAMISKKSTVMAPRLTVASGWLSSFKTKSFDPKQRRSAKTSQAQRKKVAASFEVETGSRDEAFNSESHVSDGSDEEKSSRSLSPTSPMLLRDSSRSEDTTLTDHADIKIELSPPQAKADGAQQVHPLKTTSSANATSVAGRSSQGGHSKAIAESRRRIHSCKIYQVDAAELEKADISEREQNCVRDIVTSRPFCFVSGMMILGNAIVIASSTEYEATMLKTNQVFSDANMCLNIWYAIELVAKLMAYRCEFFRGEDWRWNWLDFFLVILSVLDFMPDVKQLKDLSVARMFRLLRLLRNVRLVRYMKAAGEFRKMILSMVNCLQSLGWASVVLMGVTFTFAVIFTQIGTMYRMTDADPRISEGMSLYFGNLFTSMLSLFMCTCNGIGWDQVAEPLWAGSYVYGMMFISYMFLTLFGVLNIITSVFVDQAMQITQCNRDLLVRESTSKKQAYVNHIRDLFQRLDKGGCGSVTVEQVEHLFSDESLGEYLAALELNPSSAKTLFHLLDNENTGKVDIDQFCWGCLRLKGEAKSFDICVLMREVEDLVWSFQHALDAIETTICALDESICKLHVEMAHVKIALELDED
eukprot:TRINITY_DN6879_c0_g1_i1.p1 TRINITY_DN6879_c0_g1~~TRINITY_DN6879_c0_g1_i1.p1  ORF type:complete len:718 (-),score=188.90 TRINITY_DN6879_c0_g1_i1:84-2237(-)